MRQIISTATSSVAAAACTSARQQPNSAPKKRKPNPLKITIDTSSRPTVHSLSATNLMNLDEAFCSSYDSTPFASQILPHLWLGDFHDACDLKSLQKHRITHILNVALECQNQPNHHLSAVEHSGITVVNFPLRDVAEENIATWFEQASLLIDRVKQNNGKVLVHCRVGISRSATIVMAYLMQTLHLSFSDALMAVRKERDIVNPNLGFILALEDYGEKLALSRSTSSTSTYSAITCSSDSTLERLDSGAYTTAASPIKV